MYSEEIEAILKQLRARLEEAEHAGDHDLMDQMISVRRELLAWQSAGTSAPLPHISKLRHWGISLPTESVDMASSNDASAFQQSTRMPLAESETGDDTMEGESPPWLINPFEQLESKPPPTMPHTSDAVVSGPSMPDGEQLAAAPDPDDALQEQFNTAQAYLNNRRYRAAVDAFDELRRKSRGNIQEASQTGYEQATLGLENLLQEPIERAERHARKQAEDLQGQRQLWTRVLEKDPKNEKAIRALAELDSREAERDSQRRVADIRDRLMRAADSLNYPDIIKILGEAEALAAKNRLPAMQRELDELVTDARLNRDRVREYLGIASTKAGSEDYRGAYAQALEYLDKRVPVAFDERGVFGPVGTEYDPVDFLKLARTNFLEWSRRKAVERQQEAAGEAPAAPDTARRTLEEARAFLTDEILTRDDKAILDNTLREIEKDILDVEERIEHYRNAERFKTDAQAAPPRERLRLLREARLAYPDFPDIDALIGRAKDAVAAVVAGELLNDMVVARQKLAAEQFQEALAALAAARSAAIRQVPDYLPGSPLASQLSNVDTLEGDIIKLQQSHNEMIADLETIDDYLRQHELNPTGDGLKNARARLEDLDKRDEQVRNHRLVLERHKRVAALRSASENWKAGQEAYTLASWSEAVNSLEAVVNAPDGDLPELEKAIFLLNRARAASLVEDARRLKADNDWKGALNKYRVAQKSFETFATTDLTDPAEPYFREARDELLHLVEFEENDRRVGAVIEQASGWLKTAAATAEARDKQPEPVARVESIPEFARAVALLSDIRGGNLRTTMSRELEDTLALARSKWRKAYLDGMRSALQHEDESLLRKAAQLGRTLEDNGLLTDTQDKAIYRTVLAKFLDYELRRMQLHPPRIADLEAELAQLEEQKLDPERVSRLERDLELLRQEPRYASALIAENRKTRLLLADAGSIEQYREEYRTAVAKRVRQQLVNKRQQGARVALDFLSRELETPELYQNEDLFVELMHLCWQVGDWREARNRAMFLANRAHLEYAVLKSEMWNSLTEMAYYLSNGDHTRYAAEWLNIHEKVQSQSQYLPLLDEQHRWLRAWRVDELVRQAEKVEQQPQPADWIQSVRLYAEAANIAAEHHRVRAGLKALGARLAPLLGDYIGAAKRLTLAGALDEAARKAQEKLEILEEVDGVADLLELTAEQKGELTDAIESLQRRLGPWEITQKRLAEAREEIETALLNPRLFQPDEPGGWTFDQAHHFLQEALREARGDRQLLQRVQEELDQLDGLVDRANELNHLVETFRYATMDEAFDQIIESARQLDNVWHVRQKTDGFQGLERLIKVNYPLDRRIPRSPLDHAKMAESHKRNLFEWQEWAKRCKEASDRIRDLGEPLQSDLRALVRRNALQTIIGTCDEIESLNAEFEDAVAATPATPPLTRRAHAQENTVSQSLRSSVSDYLARAIEKKREAERMQREQLDPALHKLRTAIRELEKAQRQIGRKPGLFKPRIESIPQVKITMADNCFSEVRSIDPLNEEVGRLTRRFTMIKSATGLEAGSQE